jgi:hypothetical protein
MRAGRIGFPRSAGWTLLGLIAPGVYRFFSKTKILGLTVGRKALQPVVLSNPAGCLDDEQSTQGIEGLSGRLRHNG